jgi:hypothetical protein
MSLTIAILALVVSILQAALVWAMHRWPDGPPWL